MLNITAQANAAGAKAYFAQQSEYYFGGRDEFIGEWGGKGAAMLGLSGQVDKKGFDQLCDNINPQTGKTLTKITRDGRRVGYDFTWSAPKSVSVLHALTGDESIVEAFRDSVRETMADMEQEVQVRVRKDKQDFDRDSGNLCYAEFVHLTSRPVKGLSCPQLHIHAFAFNASLDGVEKQWKAAQMGAIKDNGFYWQAVQQARFANKLQEIGYSIRPTKHAFEIEGVPQSVIERFSERSRLIDRVAEKLGITSAKIKAKLGATTREAKNSSIPYDALVSRWESLLTKQEAGALGMVAQDRQPRRTAMRNAEHAEFAVAHTFERASVIDERRLLTAALRHGIGEVTPEGVRNEVNARCIVKKQRDGQSLATTPEVLQEETRLLAFAVGGRASCKPLTDSENISFNDTRLNQGQRRAVKHVLTSADRVLIIRGAAGTGKSTLTREAVSQIERRGKSVVMLAPSAQASRGVLREEGFEQADTLAKFLSDERMQESARHGFIWLDEAGLAGLPTMTKLVEVADRIDARIILAGDNRQMSSVERGGTLRVLEDIAGLPTAEVTEIQRQQDDTYKEAVNLLACGRSAEGFDRLDEAGRVKLLPVWDSYAPVAKDYARKIELATEKDRDKAAIIVCPTHAEGRQLTDAVRNELKARGHLDAAEREFTRLAPLQWTEAERGDFNRYTGEEILQFHRNSGEFRAGQRIRAAEAIERLGKSQAKHFAVYAPDSICLSAGDVIRITANGKSADGRHKLNNGAVYRVAGFDEAGDIRLSNGWTVSREFGQISHGYVSTPHAAQGRTVQHAIVVHSARSAPAVNKEGFYVAASRGKRSVTIYVDDKRDVRDSIQRSDPRFSATELMATPKSRVWQRMRKTVEHMRKMAMMAGKKAAWQFDRPAEKRELIYEK